MSIVGEYIKAKKRKRTKMKSGCPYQRAIKQSMNKMFENKCAVHFNIAEIIAEYSHKSVLRPGSYLLGNRYHFFIVKQLISPHWCTGFFCPPRVEFGHANVLYHPDVRRRSRVQKKRIFDPFEHATVRCRSKQFMLDNKTSYHEPLSHFPAIYA